jgi:hypothetical protein
MTTSRPVRNRFRAEAVPFALAVLLAASLPAAAQQRHPPSNSGDSGRSAHSDGGSRGGGWSAPSAPSAPSSPSPSVDGSPRGSSSGGRTAHPVPQTPGADRQPTYRRPDRSGGHYRPGYGYGGYYGPYYDPFYSPYGYGYGSRWGWGWGTWWGPDYDPYYYPYGSHQPNYYDRDAMGALDLDVSPGRTEVYVDGQRLGTVDEFDGWPRYLWLPKGTYDVVFYLDGYKTLSRQISVYTGSVISVDDEMEQGASTRPEDLATKTHDRRDERLRYERERSRRIDQQGDRQGDDDAWRDRARRHRDYGVRRDDGNDRNDRDEDDNGRTVIEDRDDRRAPSGSNGRLVLDVDPDDASVYIDGRFVGTGTDLAMMRSGLPLTPGEHKLAVVRPGRKSEEQDFTVKAGEDVKVEVELDDSDD